MNHTDSQNSYDRRVRLLPILDKAHDLAKEEKARHGNIEPMSIRQVLSRYSPEATFEECHYAAMNAYMAQFESLSEETNNETIS